MLIIAIVPIVVCIWVALRKKYSFLASVQLSCLGCALFMLIVLGWVYLATGKDIVTVYLDMVKQTLQQNEPLTRSLYNTLLGMSGTAANSQISLTDAVNAVYPYFEDAFRYSIPAVCAAFIPVGGLVFFLLARAVAKKAGAPVTPVPAFSEFKLPPKFGRWSIAIIVVCWIGQLAGWRNFDFVFAITFAFFGSIYYILGLAFTEWLFKKQIKSAFTRFLIIALVAILFWQLYIFVFIGILEQIVKIRHRAEANKGSL